MRASCLIVLALAAALAPGPSAARKPATLVVGVEVFYAEERTARETWRAEFELALVEELHDASCVARVAEAGDPATVVLSVRLEEYTLEQGEGGSPYWDERTGDTRPGRSYLCRIGLSFALLLPPDEAPLHTDRFTVAQREGTSSNPLFNPREQAFQRTKEQTVRELRRRLCRRAPRLEREIRERSGTPARP